MKAVRIILVAFVVLIQSISAHANDPMNVDELKRICFLGDSITDGDTYPRLVETALRRAGTETRSINSGYGGNTAADMLARIDKDVLANKPTLVTLSAGANDAMRGITPEDYEQQLRKIIDTFGKANVPLILLTPCGVTGAAKEKAETALVQYDAIVRKLAKEFDLRLADVFTLHREAIARGEPVMDADGLHPGLLGQQLIAGAVLDALGFGKLEMPATPDITESAGLVKEWQILPLDGQKLSDDEILLLAPDATWQALTLPQAAPSEQYWLDHNRRFGVAVELSKQLGKKGPFVAVASVKSTEARTLRLHTGGDLTRIWLNGKLIYGGDWNGWHPGRFSVDAPMVAGENKIRIVSGDTFFLSISAGRFWE